MGTGLVIGLMALTRPTILFFAPFFGLWLLIVFPSLLRAVGVGACVLAGIAVVVGPWTIRNYFVHDEFVLISPVAWTVFLSGNNRVVATDPAYAGDSIWYSKVPEYSDKFDGLRQTERERVAKQLAIYKWLKENKELVPGLIWKKFVRFWSPFLKQEIYWESAHGNFGDDLNLWLWDFLLPGFREVHPEMLLVGVGTVLNRALLPAKTRKLVVGSGFGYGALPDISDKDEWDIRCVRGPLTAGKLGLDADMGIIDPAVMVADMPEFQNLPKVT